MNPQEEQLTRIEDKIDAVYVTSEKTRKYIRTMLIVTIVTIALPLLLASIFLPMMLSTIGGVYGI